jgi:hypothetical protein
VEVLGLLDTQIVHLQAEVDLLLYLELYGLSVAVAVDLGTIILCHI